MENQIIYYTRPGALQTYITNSTGSAAKQGDYQVSLPNMFDLPSFITEFNDLFNPYDFLYKNLRKINIDIFNEKSGIDKYPVSDIYVDKDDALVFKVATTDFEDDELSIFTENNKLHINGNKKNKDEEDDVKFSLHKRICRRDFTFSAPIPDGFDVENIAAEHKNGQITVKIPILKEVHDRIKKREISLG